VQFSIRQITFEIPDRYQAGEAIGPAEAQVLNSVRGEQIRKSLARKFPEGRLPDGREIEGLRALASELGASHELSLRDVRTGVRAGSLEAEIESVAAEQVEAFANSTGRRLSQAEFNRELAEVKELEEVKEEARRRLAERLRVVSASAEELFGVLDP
jgi:hypothetical protein